jgi:hypothetical protein
MRKGLIVLTLLLCLTAFTITLVNVHGQTPGVHSGDIYIYTTFSSWSSSSAYDSIPEVLQTINQTKSIEVRISNANDSFVDTFTATYYYNEGPSAARGSTNIKTGAIYSSPFAAIIGSNLKQGDFIHPSADGIYINQTKTGSDGRPVNEIFISKYNATIDVTLTSNRLFDQATGMLTYDLESTVDGGTVSGTRSTEAVTVQLQYTPWNPQPTPSVPEFQPIFALPIFIGAATLVLIALKKKHMISAKPVI